MRFKRTAGAADPKLSPPPDTPPPAPAIVDRRRPARAAWSASSAPRARRGNDRNAIVSRVTAAAAARYRHARRELKTRLSRADRRRGATCIDKADARDAAWPHPVNSRPDSTGAFTHRQ